MRTVFYYASWVVVITFLALILIGSVAQNGWGPIALGAVLIASVFGIINGKE